MEFIALLIFDECHHAQVQSNHPYAEIMKVKGLFFTLATNMPHFFPNASFMSLILHVLSSSFCSSSTKLMLENFPVYLA